MKEKITGEEGELRRIWYESEHLQKFRKMQEKITEPCNNCKYLKGCYGCRAIAAAQGGFYDGDRECNVRYFSENIL